MTFPWWRFFPWRWSWYDWCLERIVARDGTSTTLKGYFSLKCGLCKHFSWGCKRHWFCGLCESCNREQDRLDALEPSPAGTSEEDD